MPDITSAPQSALPSSRRLLRSTAIAAAVALGLLVTVVLPAEYGVDPTGVGRLLGLTEMGRIKRALAKEAAAADALEVAGKQTAPMAAGESALRPQGQRPVVASRAEPVATPAPPATNSHVTEIVLRPNEGKEIKLDMRKDARVMYSWSTDRGVVNYDTHADAPGIKYHGYAKGSARQSDQGALVAAFDGAHGWFWRNRGSETVTVTLKTEGDYQALKRM